MVKKDPTNASELANQLTEGILTMSEAFAPINEAVNGYKAARLAEGWSVANAETMAVEYHRMLICYLISGVTS